MPDLAKASKMSKSEVPEVGSQLPSDMHTQAHDEVDSVLSAELYTALRMHRADLVKEAGEGVNAYHLFGDATMKQISRRVPRTKKELHEINGFGRVRRERFGKRILETIEATIREHQKDTTREHQIVDESSSIGGSSRDADSNEAEKRKRPIDFDSDGNDDEAEGTVKELVDDQKSSPDTSCNAIHLEEVNESKAHKLCSGSPEIILREKTEMYGKRILEPIEDTMREHKKAKKRMWRDFDSDVNHDHNVAEGNVHSKTYVTELIGDHGSPRELHFVEDPVLLVSTDGTITSPGTGESRLGAGRGAPRQGGNNSALSDSNGHSLRGFTEQIAGSEDDPLDSIANHQLMVCEMDGCKAAVTAAVEAEGGGGVQLTVAVTRSLGGEETGANAAARQSPMEGQTEPSGRFSRVYVRRTSAASPVRAMADLSLTPPNTSNEAAGLASMRTPEMMMGMAGMGYKVPTGAAQQHGVKNMVLVLEAAE